MHYHVIIAGSRDFNDQALLNERCDHLLAKRENVVIVSGGARGADTLGERYAEQRGLHVLRMPADWNKHGKQAGYIRNQDMLQRANALIAFWDGKSRGTEHMISIARKAGLAVRVVRTNNHKLNDHA